jgi:hypothetical protein
MPETSTEWHVPLAFAPSDIEMIRAGLKTRASQEHGLLMARLAAAKQ